MDKDFYTYIYMYLYIYKNIKKYQAKTSKADTGKRGNIQTFISNMKENKKTLSLPWESYMNT